LQPYAIVSDLHAHNWSAFSTTLPNGVNSRLQIILDELERACKTLADAGGRYVYGGGDLFHVRGAVAPSVLNPVKEKLEVCHRNYGVSFAFNAGNHDLEGKHSTQLGNAVQALRCDWVDVVSAPIHDAGPHDGICVVPWIENLEDLRSTLADWSRNVGDDRPTTDLLIHAPMNDVIVGLPNKGLSAAELRSLGFRRVFVGHHHNHKDMGGGVYSIGATTHQTWNDVGTKAGFLIVTDSEVKWHASHAPSFVDVNGVDDATELHLRCDGNYVRAKLTTSKVAEIEALRKFLLERCGARGVTLQIVREPVRVRTAGATVKAGASIETSVSDFVNATITEYKEEVVRGALNVLAEAA
jgi:DNA repair exonuclease SbcCD nuclease subunit